MPPEEKRDEKRRKKEQRAKRRSESVTEYRVYQNNPREGTFGEWEGEAGIEYGGKLLANRPGVRPGEVTLRYSVPNI